MEVTDEIKFCNKVLQCHESHEWVMGNVSSMA